MASGPSSRPPSRSRGCLVLAAVAAALAVLTGVLATMALSTPDLGVLPAGSNDGPTELAIAATLATELAAGLAAGPHTVLRISEHDLTVLVRENNPNPSRFEDPHARIRDGLVVIDAHTRVGPFTVDAVARLALVLLTGSDGLPRVGAEFRAVQVGGLGLPDFAARAVQDRIQQAFDLQDLLASNPVLRLARRSLDCVGVGDDGVRLGFHRVGVAAAPGDCA
jgi:hypothetical protein